MSANLTGKISGENTLSGKLSTQIKDVTEIMQYGSIYEFPNQGVTSTLYITSDENAAYRWDLSNNRYYCIGRNYQEIEEINGGEING